jgi:amidase
VAAGRPLAEQRLAWWDDFGGVPVSAATRDGLAQLAEALARCGARVERRPPDGVDFALALEVHRELAAAEIGATKPPEQEAADAARIGRQAGITYRRYAALLMERDVLSARLERFLADHDVLLCPVAAGPAFPHCPRSTPLEVDGREVSYWDACMAFTSPFNLTGHPAVALPLTRSAEGLPIGMQLVGRRWGEVDLLAFATQVSEIVGPYQRPPGY